MIIQIFTSSYTMQQNLFSHIYNSEMFSKMMILLLRLNSACLQGCIIQYIYYPYLLVNSVWHYFVNLCN
jgi:hypothetical protein